MLGTPAVMSDRESPTTPSPVKRPRPVSQVLTTTSSALSFKSKISSEVSKPSLTLPGSSGSSVLPPDTPKPLKSSSKP